MASSIIAIENNNKGIVGIHPHAKLVSVKAKSNGTYTSKSVMQGINFMKHNNVEIINLSMNSNPASSIYADILVYNAIRDFDGIIISSVGNENANIDNHDTEFVYPSSYRSNFYFQGMLYQGLNNLIVVGAEEPDGTKRETSNFGKKSVDIFAPGGWFQTAHTNNTEKYTTSGGTSLAAPIVVGVLSLAKSAYPQKTWKELIEILHQTATPVEAYRNISISGGRLNAGAMLTTLEEKYQQGTPSPPLLQQVQQIQQHKI